jgi:hypothetical protein
MRRIVAGLTLVALGVVPAMSAVGASAAHSRGVMHDPRHTWGRSTSTNWSGYDVTGSNATDAKGSWTQPAASCSPGENSWSSPWVGLDGDTSNSVEQIGTDTDCNSGAPTYYAWYEMYPKKLVTINIRVQAGDKFSAEAKYAGNGSFVLTLTNTSSGQTFSTTQNLKRANLASAEWIMEGPSSGSLTNFGTVSFSSASGTINGVTGNIGSLSPLTPITMVTSGGVARATPAS